MLKMGWEPEHNQHRELRLPADERAAEVAPHGTGTLSPNLSDVWLVTQTPYSMSAAGSNGFQFWKWTVSTNWGAGVEAATPTLNFIMQTNLTLTVIFVDTNPPQLTVTNLTNGQQLSDAVFTVMGAARTTLRSAPSPID